jgi:hypothetical protein
MSIQDILKPNSYKLYGFQGIFLGGVQGPVIGPIQSGDIFYDTLTQNNGNSSIDIDGNSKVNDLEVIGSADITGSLQANFIETADMEVSGGIISTKVTSPEFEGVQFAGAQGRFDNLVTNSLTGSQFNGTQGNFNLLTSKLGLLNKGIFTIGHPSPPGPNALTPAQTVNGVIYYDTVDGDEAIFSFPDEPNITDYLHSLGAGDLTGYYFETNFLIKPRYPTFSIVISCPYILGGSNILINDTKYSGYSNDVVYGTIGVRILTYFTSNNTPVAIPYVCPYILLKT